MGAILQLVDKDSTSMTMSCSIIERLDKKEIFLTIAKSNLCSAILIVSTAGIPISEQTVHRLGPLQRREGGVILSRGQWDWL
jgi:hypothetical protein